VTSKPVLLLLVVLALGSCGEDPTEPNPCATAPLPLHGTTAGPVVVDVGLEVQSSGIVVVATATDPQGTANLDTPLQSVGVFPDLRCEGVPIVILDDLVGSGIEETFGTVVESAVNPALYNAIAGAASWPVTVDFQDLDGNHTIGRVPAVVRP
jgi:hypothetical protein